VDLFINQYYCLIRISDGLLLWLRIYILASLKFGEYDLLGCNAVQLGEGQASIFRHEEKPYTNKQQKQAVS
jgi:hypothetical protein